MAAIKLLKAYKSYRTRRNLVDWAVGCEEFWFVLNFVIYVRDCNEWSAGYEREYSSQKLEELGNMLAGLDAGDSIVIAKSLSHMLSLANLAEVQIGYQRRIKLVKKGDFADENSAKAWQVCPLLTLQKHGRFVHFLPRILF